MEQYLVFVGAFAFLFSVFFYIKDTVKGETKPNRISFLMWTIGPFIATAAALSDGVRWAVLPVFISGFGPFLIFLSSFANKKSYWKLEPFDYICGLFSILALVLWGITRDPNIAIMLAIVSDSFAAVPTITKTWKHPETETLWVYMVSELNVLTSFAAIESWNLSSLAFPIYLLICNAVIILAGSGRKWIS